MAFGFLKWGDRKADPRVRVVYDHIVGQARNPIFYTTYNVPDTVSGRFDMIVLHSFLFFWRLKGEDESDRAFGQEVFDTFIEDMDRSLREMGVGYQAVPKRMRKMGEAFYGRVGAYDEALTSEDPSKLAASVHRNIYPDIEKEPQQALWLAGYVSAACKNLEAMELKRLFSAEFDFPDPADFVQSG